MAGDSNFSNVVLLLPCDGANGSTTFKDRSNNRKTVTVNGGAQVSTAQSVFGGASAVFDGTGDYLSLADNADFELGSNNFTLRARVRFAGYATANSGTYSSTIFAKDVSGSRGFVLGVSGTASSLDSLDFTGYSDNTTPTTVSASHSFSLNTWYHIEVVRSGNTVYLFVDGVLKNTGGTSFTTTIQNTTSALKIGASEYDATFKRYLNGYLDDIEIYNGYAAHTATFTVPSEPNQIGLETQPDANYSSVVLLINGDGSTLVDESSSAKTITAGGSAAVTKADSKVGEGSVVFDGSGDYLTLADSADWDFGTGDFTVELWANFTSHTTTQTLIGNYLNSTTGWTFQRRTASNTFSFANGDTFLASKSWIPTDGVWYHMAVCRSGTSLRLFVDGTQLGTTDTSSADISGSTTSLFVGALSTTLQPYNGYLDGVRITKGVARYTANFTVPNYVFANYPSLVPTQGTVTLTGLQPSIAVGYAGTAAQRQLTLTGQTPSIPTAFTGTATQGALTLTGQTPSIPTAFTGSATQGTLTLTGQLPTLDTAIAPTGDVTGRGFVTTPVIYSGATITGRGFTQFPVIGATAGTAAIVTGRGFTASVGIHGGAVVTGRGFTSDPAITVVAAETAYITGQGFNTVPAIEISHDFPAQVTGRGFSSNVSVIGGAVITGRAFQSAPTIALTAPTYFDVTGQGFATNPTITAEAITAIQVTGRGFVSGIGRSIVLGGGFSQNALIRGLDTALFEEAFVMNLVPPAENLYSVSRYQNYPFIHIARIANTYYGLTTNGLYELTGDYDLDAEVFVNGTIQLNEDDLSAFNSQNIPYIYLNGEDDYSATAYVDDVAQPTFTSGFGGRRVKLARGSKGRYWYFKIEGIKALQGVEYRPEKLARKVK